MSHNWVKVNRKPTGFGGRITVFWNNRNTTALIQIYGCNYPLRPSDKLFHLYQYLELSLPAITSSIDFIDNIAKLTVKCQICWPLCIRFSLHPLRCNCVKSLNSTLRSAVRVQCAKVCAHMCFVHVLHEKHVRETGYREVDIYMNDG